MTKISIHAPREGGDGLLGIKITSRHGFQSTPPARGATRVQRALQHDRPISIHAPREGGDWIYRSHQNLPEGFQSTPPARGATVKMHSFTCGSLTNK